MSVEAGANPAELATDAGTASSLAADAARPTEFTERWRRAWSSTRDAVQIAALSVALWLLYVPHYVVLRLLGPRWGMHWVRLAANVHWLTTFVGAQRPARQALRTLRPYFDTRLSVSQILRRHLTMKHECFARVRVYSQHAAQMRHTDIQWRCNPDCADALPPTERERGLIVVGYHFNFYQTFAAALARYFPGVDIVQLRYSTSRCVEKAGSPIVRLALKKAMEADRRAGANVLYIDDSSAIIELYRILRRSGVVAVTADGGAEGEFVEVPFFDGVFRAPSGWAKLAAATKSDVLLVCDKEIEGNIRDGLFFNHIRLRGTSSAEAYEAVAESVRILEQLIREEPWGWHPWQRLRVEVGEDGVRRYSLKQWGFKNGDKLDGAPLPRPAKTKSAEHGEAIEAKPAWPLARKRPRVAVLANSYPPYRLHLHKQIVAQTPEIELWSLATHSNSYQRWQRQQLPEAIRPLDFGRGEPTNQQADQRYAIREWFKAARIIRWLERNNVAAVFSQGCGDVGRMRIIRWCKRRGIPVFLTGDFNVRSDNHRGFKRWLKRQVYTRAVQWSTGLMPCGQLGLELLKRYGGEGKPALMFPFAPDMQLFEQTPPEAIDRMRRQFGLDPQRRRIVFSARMVRAKRPDLAVAAFAAIAQQRPEWDLIMVGDGPLRTEMEAGAPLSLRERITWTGFLNDAADVAGLYAQSDVLLLPSDHEPWGVVVVEAAAAGLAIVASDMVGASPELVKDGCNGRVFRAGDVKALTEALLEITAAERIDKAKRASRQMLDEWLERCDPVKSFRVALTLCGLLPESEQAACRTTARTHTMGLDGVAAVPV